VEHLIKECHKWRKEREKLKKEINTAIWHHKGTEYIFADRKNTPAILKFLEMTEIGNKMSEKKKWQKRRRAETNYGGSRRKGKAMRKRNQEWNTKTGKRLRKRMTERM
jgi:hypothetical protein